MDEPILNHLLRSSILFLLLKKPLLRKQDWKKISSVAVGSTRRVFELLCEEINQYKVK